MKNDTARMIDAAAESGASEVLGAVLEQQARERDWVNEQVVAGKDAEIERLTRQRDAALDRLDLIESRVLWLLGRDER